jgi:glycosyltransferase involved in cell wall biosynthesis
VTSGSASTRVSVVVPAYNNATTIERTVDSILAQTHRDLEVIIADHSSKDDTWQVLQRYASDPRVTLLQTPAGGGAQRNWNRVSQAATSSYLKLVCGDDLIAPTLVAEQVAALEANPSATLSACSRDVVDVHDRPVIRGRGLGGFRGFTKGRDAITSTVAKGTNIFGEPACVLVRTATLERVGWWDSRFPYLIDEATYVRVLLEGEFVAVPKSLASFRMSDTQWSVALVNEQSEQVTAFHRWLHETHPEIVSRFALWRGNLAARVNARLRRTAYIVLRARMRESEA